MRLRPAGIAIITGATATALLGAAVSVAAKPAATSRTLAFYEKNSGLSYTNAVGKTTSTPPVNGPAVGSILTFSDLDYSGSLARHAKSWVASDYFVCAFSKSFVPTCNGELALGGSMLIVHGTGGQGVFTIPIVGGTGAFRGYKGRLKISDIGETLDADIVATIGKP